MPEGQVQIQNGKVLISDNVKVALGPSCCTCSNGDCNNCLSNYAPWCMELTLTGVARNSPEACRACDCVNGIEMELEYEDATCIWTGYISVPCDCMGDIWTLRLVEESGDYIWRLTGDGATFENNVGTDKPNCMTTNETLTYQSQTAAATCDYSGASAAIVARDPLLLEGCISPQPEKHEAEYESLIGSKFCDECGSDYPVNGLYITLSNWKCTPPPQWGECCNDCESINGTYFLERCPEDGWFETNCHRFIYEFPSRACQVVDFMVCQFSILPTGGTHHVLLGGGLATREYSANSLYCASGIPTSVASLFSLLLGEAPIACSNFSQSGRALEGIVWNGKVCGIGADRGNYTIWW